MFFKRRKQEIQETQPPVLTLPIKLGPASLGVPDSYENLITELDLYKEARRGGAVLPQPEQNGLFPPAEEAATWISCVDAAGNITPVYDEADVRSFTVPMENNPAPNGFGIVPVPGGKPSYEIDPTIPASVDAPPQAAKPPTQPGN